MRTLCLLSLLAACGTSGTGMGGDDGSGTGPTGTQQDPQPAKTGPYTVVTTVDFTVEAIVPAQVEDVVVSLREFSTNPAQAMITLADAAGVPAASTIYGLVPGPLRDKLDGWVNGEVAKVTINGQPITAYASDVAGLVDFALTDFAVDSEIAIGDGGTATHKLTALDLTPTGLDVRIPITGLASDILTQTPDVEVGAGGALVFGEQHFGLNYGEYAWQGVEAMVTAKFGQGVKETFLAAANCPAIAQGVANKCVLGICVGHASEIQSVCEGGIGAIVDAAHAKLASYRIEAFHLASGGATLVDDDGDGVGDRIIDGTWDAEMNLGLGLRHTPATFAGAR